MRTVTVIVVANVAIYVTINFTSLFGFSYSRLRSLRGFAYLNPLLAAGLDRNVSNHRMIEATIGAFDEAPKRPRPHSVPPLQVSPEACQLRQEPVVFRQRGGWDLMPGSAPKQDSGTEFVAGRKGCKVAVA